MDGLQSELWSSTSGHAWNLSMERSLDPNPILLPTETNYGMIKHQPAHDTNAK